MDKFTNKIGKIDSRKYTDKTKNDIYNMIKENLSVRINGNEEYIDSDLSIDGLEELTDVLYNYVQQEKTKQEVITLEKIKLNVAVGSLNIKSINEHIDNIKNHILKEDVDLYQGDKHLIKIVKCSSDSFWYKDNINQEFQVVDGGSKNPNQWKVVPDEKIKSGVFYINKDDVKIIK